MMTVVPPEAAAGDVVEADDGGDAQGPGDDGGVAGGPAGVGGEPLDVRPVHAGRLRRCQVVSQHVDVPRQVAEGLALLAGQVAQQAFLDVVDVLDAVGEVFGHVAEFRGIGPQDRRDGVLGRHVPALDGLLDLRLEDLVIEQAEVEVEDAGGFLADAVDGPPLEVEDLFAADLQGPSQAVHLALGAVDGHVAFGDLELLVVDNDHRGDGHPGRNSNALLDNHWGGLEAWGLGLGRLSPPQAPSLKPPTSFLTLLRCRNGSPPVRRWRRVPRWRPRRRPRPSAPCPSSPPAASPT